MVVTSETITVSLVGLEALLVRHSHLNVWEVKYWCKQRPAKHPLKLTKNNSNYKTITEDIKKQLLKKTLKH